MFWFWFMAMIIARCRLRYDQEENEWVVVLQGNAEIRFEDGDITKTLSPGEYLQIPAHARHRVDKTDSDQPTVWLVLHYP